MSELIRREDCDFFAPSAGTDEIILNLMAEYSLTWDTNPNNDFDADKIYEFARELLECAQNYVNSAPTITTDDILAYKCPECKVISILYNPETEQYCPNCGIKRRTYND